jgi:hypothetical protein
VKNPFVRGLLGVTGGLILGVLCVVGFELVSSLVFPMPKSLNMKDPAAMAEYVSTLPIAALVLVLAGYLVGTLAGSFTAAKIGQSQIPGYIVGACLLIAGVSNMMMIPHPTWFWVASIVIFIAMTILGARGGRQAPPPVVVGFLG